MQRAGRCAAAARGFRGYEREEANAEAARARAGHVPPQSSLSRRATAIRKHVRVKAARDPTGAAPTPQCPSVPRTARRRARAHSSGCRRAPPPSTCSNSARPTSAVRSPGAGAVRPPTATERTDGSVAPRPPRRKARTALCSLLADWLCLAATSASVSPPTGPSATTVSRQVARLPLGTSRFLPFAGRARTGRPASAHGPRRNNVPAAYLPAGPRLARRGLLAQFIADTATLN
ncbi:hypothetical protein GQ55_2G272800 [Panicum hallii var. hallii]|uniref:Uncharacterized protein n=1 Tax=Panicum hallii var. hallii TaxID=1504633 RepID=A0A2T7ESU8_9POAL|nr:hypothetical protein GQ55_2G272800 [Panicum hallii var. hallii]